MVRPHLACALAVGFGSMGAGCGPDIPASWRVVDALDLGMVVEVERGPLSLPSQNPTRSSHDAIPLDRIRARVAVADVDGPVPDEALEFAWTVCASTSCWVDTEDPCPTEGFAFSSSCSLGISSTADVLLGWTEDPETVYQALATGAVGLRAIGSVAGEPGAAACLARLESGEDLGGCMIVDGFAGLGSPAELTALLESVGETLPPGLISDATLQMSRNHVPRVERLIVHRSDDTVELVEPGDTISAHIGEALELEWLPMLEDREPDSLEAADGTTLTVEDTLAAHWWTSERANTFDFSPGATRLSWTLGADEGTYPLYLMVNDDRFARSWVSFQVEVSR